MRTGSVCLKLPAKSSLLEHKSETTPLRTVQWSPTVYAVNNLAPTYLLSEGHNLLPLIRVVCALQTRHTSRPSPEAWTGPAPTSLLGRPPLLSLPPPLLAAPVSSHPKHRKNLYYYTGHISSELFVSKFAPVANCEDSFRTGSNSYSSMTNPRRSAQ